MKTGSFSRLFIRLITVHIIVITRARICMHRKALIYACIYAPKMPWNMQKRMSVRRQDYTQETRKSIWNCHLSKILRITTYSQNLFQVLCRKAMPLVQIHRQPRSVLPHMRCAHTERLFLVAGRWCRQECEYAGGLASFELLRFPLAASSSNRAGMSQVFQRAGASGLFSQGKQQPTQ